VVPIIFLLVFQGVRKKRT